MIYFKIWDKKVLICWFGLYLLCWVTSYSHVLVFLLLEFKFSSCPYLFPVTKSSKIEININSYVYSLQILIIVSLLNSILKYNCIYHFYSLIFKNSWQINSQVCFNTWQSFLVSSIPVTNWTYWFNDYHFIVQPTVILVRVLLSICIQCKVIFLDYSERWTNSNQKNNRLKSKINSFELTLFEIRNETSK